MKKFGKIAAALLALVMVASLFSACGNNNNKEEPTTDSFTLQVNNSEAETTEESTTQADGTTEVTAKEEKTTKVTVKIPSLTKAEDKTTTATPTTKPAVTEEKETFAPNLEKLIGRWEARYDVEGVTVYMQMEFKRDNSVETELTKRCYDKMINEIVERDAFGVTQEQFDAFGVDNATAYKEALREYLHQELPFDELKDDFKSTGTWELDGNALKVTIDGETAVSCEGFDGGLTDFGMILGLDFADGSHISLSKIV